MNRKQKKAFVRIIAAAALFVAALCIPAEGLLRLLLFLAPFALVGWDVLWRAVRNIAHGQIFDENFLMALATVGAFFLGEYPEGVAVMLFLPNRRTVPKLCGRTFAQVDCHIDGHSP